MLPSTVVGIYTDMTKESHIPLRCQCSTNLLTGVFLVCLSFVRLQLSCSASRHSNLTTLSEVLQPGSLAFTDLPIASPTFVYQPTAKKSMQADWTYGGKKQKPAFVSPISPSRAASPVSQGPHLSLFPLGLHCSGQCCKGLFIPAQALRVFAYSLSSRPHSDAPACRVFLSTFISQSLGRKTETTLDLSIERI